MLTISNAVTPSPAQWEAIIRGMRNPMNSWGKSDSYSTYIENPVTMNSAPFEFFLGDNDISLMIKLVKNGSVHAKFRRMISVYVDVLAPLYWWKEFDTYKVGTVVNSCSTMHKIGEREFEVDDFSHEHLLSFDHDMNGYDVLNSIVNSLNIARAVYMRTKDKKHWWQMIQMLPSSYNQKRTVMLNYEVLSNIYQWRRNHKLDEWHTFCDWIEGLPYAGALITLKEDAP